MAKFTIPTAHVSMQILQDSAAHALDNIEAFTEGDLEVEMTFGRTITNGPTFIEALRKDNLIENVVAHPEKDEVEFDVLAIEYLIDVGMLCQRTLGIAPPTNVIVTEREIETNFDFPDDDA